MTAALRTPGVYLRDIAISAPTAMQTGVPAFVGFATTKDDGGPGPVVLEHVEEFPARFSTDDSS